MYPKFLRTRDNSLVAILNKERAFHLNRNTFTRGAGFEFRIYKTRATVRNYEHAGSVITFQEFKDELQNVFAKYLLELTELLPKELQAGNTQKLIE